MKSFSVLPLLFLALSLQAQVAFDDYFTDRTMRFDFVMAGNSTTTKVFPVSFREEPFWGGSLVNLIDPFNYGNFRYEIFDAVTGKLIYSRGFCTLYQEWQTTAEAKQMERVFQEVATFPFPKNKVNFVLSIRGRDGQFSRLYETAIDPASYFITREKPEASLATRIAGSGDPHTSLDIAFIAEGYTSAEMEKFRNDVKRMAEYLFAEAPFDKYKDRINIWAVEAPSQQSGTDVPGEGIYVNTALSSSYYTFDVDRYLTTQSIHRLNDYAASAPHDQIIVLINSPYSSEVAYEEFYPLDVEPWEPNITTRVNFDAKWKYLIAKSVPIPTPNDKRYIGVTGLFEGGGYSARGIYRPSYDCRMKSNVADGFCEVCQEALEKMILFYLE